MGGRFGLDTINQQAVELAAARDPLVVTVVGLTAILKVAGAVFSLALVQPWGGVFPRRLMLMAGWGGTLLLTLYGGLQTGAQLLVASGVIQASADMDWWAFYWHLWLWSPWFLVWGILLGMTVRRYQARTRRDQRGHTSHA